MSDPADPVAATPGEALAGFIGKWHARWPEWAVVEAFVAKPHRPTALAWAALQQELTDAAWGGQDPRPGELKLAWWQEELHGWTAGRRRHPLGSVLQRLDAPWTTLAAALPGLPASRERSRDPDEAVATLRGFAAAVAAIDVQLFGADRQPGAESDVIVVASTLLATRAIQPGSAHVPLSVLAACAAAAAPVSWRDHVARNWPRHAASTRPRRLWAALARARLGQPDPAAPLPSWRALATGWRGARDARN